MSHPPRLPALEKAPADLHSHTLGGKIRSDAGGLGQEIGGKIKKKMGKILL